MKALEMTTDRQGVTETGNDVYCLDHGCGEWEHDNLKPNTRYACCMIAIPDGYRLVTDDEREKYKKCRGLKYTSNCRTWRTVSRTSTGWIEDHLYAIPIDHTWAEDKPRVSITVEVNGEAVDPATLSAESWAALRGGV